MTQNSTRPLTHAQGEALSALTHEALTTTRGDVLACERWLAGQIGQAERDKAREDATSAQENLWRLLWSLAKHD